MTSDARQPPPGPPPDPSSDSDPVGVSAAGDADSAPALAGPAATPPLTRGRALAEVVLCSGFPTQLAIAGALQAVGLGPAAAGGGLSASFVFIVSLADSVVLLVLIVALLRRQGVRPFDVLIGPRPVWRESMLGASLVPMIVIGIGAIMLGLRAAAPWLHNVPENPLTTLVSTRAGLMASLVVVIVAGGLREELQRAFLLRRFTERLGGPIAGVAITSVAFGLGHTLQGWDAAIATGLLGAVWGRLTLARGGAVAAMTSHAGFNAIELVIAATVARPIE